MGQVDDCFAGVFEADLGYGLAASSKAVTVDAAKTTRHENGLREQEDVPVLDVATHHGFQFGEEDSLGGKNAQRLLGVTDAVGS